MRAATWRSIVMFLAGWVGLWLTLYAAAWGLALIAPAHSLAGQITDLMVSLPFPWGMTMAASLAFGSLGASVVAFKFLPPQDVPLRWLCAPAWLVALGLCAGFLYLLHLALMSIMDIGPDGL